MRILIFSLCFTLCISIAYANNKNVEKTILVSLGENSALSIENLYISPREDRPAFIAFYGEDQQHIYLYNTGSQKITAFQFKASKSWTETTSISFVTFCWDQRVYGAFAAVFSTYGEKLVFVGSINGNKQLKRLKSENLAGSSTAFNYRDGILSFLNLDNGKIQSAPGKNSLHSLGPPRASQVITDFKQVQKNGHPYFALRNIVNNDTGIYYGKRFKKVVDSPDFDELYPHYSADGEILGYIERDKKTASARVCLKVGKKNPVRSKFTFALEENALLREYQRMFFVGRKLYYFKKEPDNKSKHSRYGLFLLMENGKEEIWSYQSRIIAKNDKFIDIQTNNQALCTDILKFPIVKTIIPFKSNGKTHFIFLTNQGNYEIKIKVFQPVYTQAIVISDHRLLMEVR